MGVQTMANIQEHVAKDGTVSYRIRVHRGRDAQGRQLNPFQMTWTPEPKMTKRQIEKELQKQAAIFEEQCKQGLIGDGSQRFALMRNMCLTFGLNQVKSDITPLSDTRNC